MREGGGGVRFDGAEAVGEEVGCFGSGLWAGELGRFVVHLREVHSRHLQSCAQSHTLFTLCNLFIF